MRNSAVFLALTCSAVVAGCARLTPISEALAAAPRVAVEGSAEFFQELFSSRQKNIEAVEIGRALNCNSQGREAAVNLFTDVAAIKAWEISRGVQLTPVTGSLPPGTYVIAEMGERNTGGYALAISRQAAFSDDKLYLKATYLHPSTSGMATQMLTAPCSLVAVRSDKTFTAAALLDQSNKLRAKWALANASAPLAEPPTLLSEPAPAVEVLHPEIRPADATAAPATPTVADLPLPVATPSVSPTP